MISTTAAQASFIANFHENYHAGNNTIFIFGDQGTTGTATGNDGFSQNFSIDATGVFELGLGVSGREMTASASINNLSVLVESADPISGLALNRAGFTTDMTTLLDLDALSTDYRVLTIGGGFGDGSQMSVTATADNTTVTITPDGIGGLTDGVPVDVVLNKGETIYYESGGGGDLSGTRVQSTSAVAVFAGTECTNVGGVAACDHLIQQQFGVENFDTEFLVAGTPFAGADKDLIRVIAAEDGTEVFINNVSQGTINAGEVLEVDNVGNASITSDKPVSVGQFMRGVSGTRTTGDPAFALIPSVDQLLDAYSFTTPVGGDAFSDNQLNIAIAQADAASLELNGVAVDTSMFTLLDGILYGTISVGIGAGVVEADNAFLATISGFDNADSYLTPIASAFSPGVSPPPPPPPDPNVVPLPASAMFLMGGLGILGVMRRRRKA
ncbi:VPLPA-CTERM sorting domain-containing protein [Octadecabacter sp. 1_MG-2023]|uniref:VPLPA-CTERM sorting domain-containing protein n=1 Tax=unclassified Octadecabacter TaxID=196158 RepID=UPI001C083EF8|nr:MULTISPECIES: VPLPA-CTERM sorting domain-containing protein [unclassified Octadecabacter]MBU2993395.1 VPLPA-CTERM sorting domain-containing protein [Octadecabacter sp. B2R22]MDO6733149.1 VPLPA-CTERM sorting domain-containing protein [Octadecabacter sp. 1_MG-2023]